MMMLRLVGADAKGVKVNLSPGAYYCISTCALAQNYPPLH